jgi:probable phosphoglycerate mutase
MAIFFLIRHGMTDMVPKTAAGRMKGVHLNSTGREQVSQLTERLSGVSLDRLCSSPLERTLETAEPIAGRLGLDVQILEGLTEIDCGAWTGRDFEDLKSDPLWHSFNNFRSITRIPRGELILNVQSRMVAELEELREELPHGNIGIVSHGDPIKAAICYYSGLPLDFMLRLEISPASVSILQVSPYGPRILCINSTGELFSPNTW